MEISNQNLINVRSSDQDVAILAARALASEGGDFAIPTLIDQIQKTDNPWIRNAIALALKKLRAEASVPILINLAKKLVDTNNCGTLVYAVQEFECREYVADLAFLLCNGSYEVREMAMQIVEEFDPESLDQKKKEEALEILKNCKTTFDSNEGRKYVDFAVDFLSLKNSD